jgi:putative oxidoreductase
MPHNPAPWAAPLGRLLLALIFILSAVGKLNDWPGTAKLMSDRGLPAVDVLLSTAVGLELVGGLLVLLGLYARWGALALLIFLVPVTVIMHNFWAAAEPERMGQFISFMKNVSITGGLLLVLSLGAGPWSIDAIRLRPRPTPL